MGKLYRINDMDKPAPGGSFPNRLKMNGTHWTANTTNIHEVLYEETFENADVFGVGGLEPRFNVILLADDAAS